MRIVIGCMLLILLAGCKQGGNAPASAPEEALEVDTETYEVEEVPNSEADRMYLTDRSGNITEEGFLANDKKQGTWITYHPGSDIPKTLTTFVDGNANGLYLEFNERGQISMQAKYRNNKLHGYWAKYRFGRPTMEAEYLDGQLHGTVYEYDLGTGALQKEITYDNGVLNGPYRYYNEEGMVTIEYIYQNGNKVSGGAVNPSESNQPR